MGPGCARGKNPEPPGHHKKQQQQTYRARPYRFDSFLFCSFLHLAIPAIVTHASTHHGPQIQYAPPIGDVVRLSVTGWAASQPHTSHAIQFDWIRLDSIRSNAIHCKREGLFPSFLQGSNQFTATRTRGRATGRDTAFPQQLDPNAHKKESSRGTAVE
mmetsp:Transcript_109720/g.224188  ORF Transcript_109720/g.224188 Transcript_109720/m.224188 type:complete len:158 (-) Transcript_109720:1403-1876(-)